VTVASNHPDECFTQAQAALGGGGQPELELGGTKGDDVTRSENRGLNGSAVDGDQGVGRGSERETFQPIKFQREVLIPNAVVVELEIVPGRTADTERKTAGCRLSARLSSRKDVELNHNQRRSTWIWSLG